MKLSCSFRLIISSATFLTISKTIAKVTKSPYNLQASKQCLNCRGVGRVEPQLFDGVLGKEQRSTNMTQSNSLSDTPLSAFQVSPLTPALF